MSFHSRIRSPRLRQHRLASDRYLGLVLVHPTLDLLRGHLGVELDPPDALAEPERLRAERARRELDSARGNRVRVVVPLEGVEALREARRRPDRRAPHRSARPDASRSRAPTTARRRRAPPWRVAARRDIRRRWGPGGREAAAGGSSPRGATDGARRGPRAWRRRRRGRPRNRPAAGAVECPRQGSTPRARLPVRRSCPRTPPLERCRRESPRGCSRGDPSPLERRGSAR